MSAIQLAKQAYSALNREKPRSSITEWVEILTSGNYEDEAYDGIPEIVESINIQATGPAEASRAIRKKLKHGDSHQQYRALVILKALVENGGHTFQTSFADAQLTDAIKHLASDPGTDPKVKKKLLAVLAAWHSQFKDESGMSLVANLYKQCKPVTRAQVQKQQIAQVQEGLGLDYSYIQKQAEKERKKRDEEKRKQEEKARRKKEEKERREKPKIKPKRPFNFEEEKPQILTAIANASQASNNLVNAITLVNTEHDSLQTNERVQDCLANAKLARKQIVRYVQLVENEDMIGTLIDTNDRIIAALESYDMLVKANLTEQDVRDVQEGLAAAKIQDTELGKLQEKQRAAIQRSQGRASSATLLASRGKGRDDDETHDQDGQPYAYPDLQDLSFGPLGAEQRGLPPPIRPSALSSDDERGRRGSLSDFSDYQSSDEETHNQRASTSAAARSHQRTRDYVDVSDNEEEVNAARDPKTALLHEEDDPFADPFAD
ncbi:hypothetical protein CERSUDRAFT_79493 [Gelatoporia subvermispora B]|uniref:VHS domain-containing protein n=1 Tax=Ceriporiopsis subvermispora (strain B) TaxID=914234 RepID=M2QXM3_CERS8|nr:hypothetical protein CERSUDRAFT_79493 [Gelatoporia subvermispora B]